MHCPSCGAGLPEDSKFCGQCGTALPSACAACGRANPTEAKFCSACGASLLRDKSPSKAPTLSGGISAAAPTSPAERRQLTIMFCDMVGSSALSTRLDPEEQRDVVGAFQACCASEIKRLGGMVAQYLGDGVLAYFGYPTAHEDDAERAVHAALAILDVVGALKPAADVILQARIGIASGVVVVGDLVREGGTQENAAIGETTNLAARLQSLAEPNTIVISPQTHRLVGALFEYHDLGRHSLKGFAEPVHVRQVAGASELESRFEAMHQSGTSPLLGREEELDLLVRRWEQAKRGEGRVALVIGEPGIGKSRLTRAVKEHLRSEPHSSFSYYCSPYHQDSALYPIIAQLLRAAGIERNDGAETRLEKLEGLLAPSSEKLAEDVPLFAALLSIPSGNRYPLPDPTTQRLKERTLAALVGQLERFAARQPVLMTFEDLHWIDPTSLELLSLIIDRIASLPVLLLATSRPEFTPPWPNHSHVSTVALGRLGRAEVLALVDGVTKSKALPPEVLDQIVARTDGVPLFIEELTKTVLESGLLQEAGNRFELAGPLPRLAIPSTLHASLLARLDQLAPVRDLAQIGAAIGREFSYGLIAAVSPLPERQLREALAQLVQAELVYARGRWPDITYHFKHALVQDAAYASLLRARRQQLHAGIAEALQQKFPDAAMRMPEVLARHYGAAGLDERAKFFWTQAGRQALSRSYYAEASTHLRNALTLVRKEAHSEGRIREESELLLGQAQSLMALKGPGAVEYGQIAAELIRVSAPLGEDMLHFRARWTDWHYNSVSGNLSEASERADLLVAMSGRMGTIDARLQAHHSRWTTAFLRGQVATACDAVEHGLTDYDLDQHRGHLVIYGAHDPGVCARGTGACTFWQAGFPERAAWLGEDAIRVGNLLKHPVSQCVAYWYAGFTSMMVGDARLARDQAQATSELAGQVSFAWGMGIARIIDGWATTRLGELGRGADQMEAAFRALVDAKQLGFLTFLGTLVADAKLKMGRTEDALSFLDDLQQLATDTHQQLFISDVHRLRADALRKLDPQSRRVEPEYQLALELASQQGAPSLELRAATSLADHWRSLGRDAEARGLLAPIYGWFTEGLDTPDLKGAKALLDQLDS